MAKVLVPGGAGYIGSHTAQKLIETGHHVIVYDNFSTGFRDAIPANADIIVGDIRDQTLLSRVLSEHGIDIVVQFAAKLNVEESTRLPFDYYENNTGGMISILQACKENKVDKIVFSSTAAVYGNSVQQGLIKEDSPKSPLNAYGWSKYFCEQILMDAWKAHSIRSIHFRYFNVAGAAEDGTNGQRTKNAYHLIHLASLTAAGKRPELNIYGNDYPTKDGTCVRDYIHVEDLADIHVLGVEHLLKGGSSDVFNCGYGRGYSVKEVIEAMKEVSGVDFPVKVVSRRPGDPARLVADSSKLQTVLNWTSQRNDLKKICRSALEWERKLLK